MERFVDPGGTTLTSTRGEPTPTTRFDAYAARLFERKIAEGTIRSAAGRRKWLDVLGKHLRPAFGPVELPSLRRVQIVAWRASVAERIAAGEVSPTSCGGSRSDGPSVEASH